MQVNMTDTDYFDLTVLEPLNRKDRTAQVDGPTTITSSNPALLEVVQTGPSTAKVSGVAPGSAQVVVSADADLGPGQSIINDPAVNVTMSPSPATHFSVALGPVTPQP